MNDPASPQVSAPSNQKRSTGTSKSSPPFFYGSSFSRNNNAFLAYMIILNSFVVMLVKDMALGSSSLEMDG